MENLQIQIYLNVKLQWMKMIKNILSYVKARFFCFSFKDWILNFSDKTSVFLFQ